MSNIQRFENLKQIVVKEQNNFEKLAKIHGAVNFEKEAAFALQSLETNDYLAGIAMNNQDSLKRAVINVAAIGLTLSPVHKLAYLIPRKKEVCLDLSYLGLVKLATDCGAVKFVVSNLVYENDTFQLKGIGKEPTHEYNPFGNRGKLLGVYCVAKTHDDDFITTTMSIEEVYKIRDRSESYKSGSNSPWKSDEGEMIKKTCIRRASKMWPKTGNTDRFEKAIDISNQNDATEIIETTAKQVEDNSDLIKQVKDLVKELGRNEEDFIKYLSNVCQREIKLIDDLTEIELKKQITALIQMNENKKKSAKPKEVASPLKDEKKDNADAMKQLDEQLGLTDEK